MWEQIIEKIILYMIGVALPFIGGWIALQWKKTKAIEGGLQALLRAELIRSHDQYTNKGYMPIYARENYDNCYKHYKTLGADGVIDDLVSEIHSLPLKERVKKNA